MKNKVSCENCKTENDYYKMNCDNCGSLLRDKFPNIDLFSTIWQLVESPSNAFKKIIYSEHKNYQLFILALVVLKLTFSSFFLQSILIEPVDYQRYFSINLSIGYGAILLLFIFFPLLFKIIFQNNGIQSRYKDNLATLIYSQIPILLFLVIILPIEFALFGKYWLFSNPSPFLINTNVAYIFSFMEFLAFVWSFILVGISLKIHSNSKKFAIISTIVFMITLLSIQLFIPYLG
jgi:hypothetical protein